MADDSYQTIARRFKPLLLIFVLLFFPSQSHSYIEASEIRHWSAPDHTRIVIDLNKEASYEVSELKSPPRLVIDLKGTLIKSPVKEIRVSDPIVERIRIAYLTPTTLRVVVDLVREANFCIFPLALSRKTKPIGNRYL